MAHRTIKLPTGAAAIPEAQFDSRSDEEITKVLLKPSRKVTSQKNIWGFWAQGFLAMPSWQKRNVIGWVRKLGAEWQVRVLDEMDGPAHFSNFLEAEDVPEPVLSASMSGPHANQHTSDAIRLPLLYRYGGIYLDVGAMLFGNLETMFWNHVSDPESRYRVGGFANNRWGNSWCGMHNFFIAAAKGEELIWRWHQIMLELWKGRTSCAGIHKNPIFKDVSTVLDPMLLMVLTDGWEENAVDYGVHMLAWQKMKMTVDADGGWNGPLYFREHVLLYEPVEAFAADIRTRLNTQRLFNMLGSSRDGEADPDMHADAEALVNFLITNSTMMKLYHGHGHLKLRPLASLWDESEKDNIDVQPGTFGEYMRYAGEMVAQQREVVPVALEEYDGPVIFAPLAK